MLPIETYGDYETAWCPGCGNHNILKALKQALAALDLPPHKLALFSGIGQAAKSPHYLNCNFFNGLHGRSLPPAQGAKLANPELAVIVESGDGCSYGEGGNHFLAAVRRNLDITCLVHDNQIYGLTKGQASPTTGQGHATKAQPFGAPSEAFNPVAVAVAMRASFVARGFSGDTEHLSELIMAGVRHKGFALIDILQPCVTFNHVNTFGWYRERCVKLADGYDRTDWRAAMDKAAEFGETIPIGVIYENDRPTFESRLPTVGPGALAERVPDMDRMAEILLSYA
ncbi:MAG: 2-oxoacid:ferredoxin oxidoreductase subunit beta [Desulfovibrionaceae bacterium]|nr:2-oxoacid:ferredoxin oxidoreductase subunit beta [Desulfovibrionaceae bacterium]MBF0514900.1 2-oxoacid:ferredoxin oxidoreductase subunit beta [Desulfovibrionaceae bacterium]